MLPSTGTERIDRPPLESKEACMAGIKRPSFTKKLKEQKRLARANAKRDARQARRNAQKEGAEPDVSADVPDQVTPA